MKFILNWTRVIEEQLEALVEANSQEEALAMINSESINVEIVNECQIGLISDITVEAV